MNSCALLGIDLFARELHNLLSGIERKDFVPTKNIDYDPKGKNYEIHLKCIFQWRKPLRVKFELDWEAFAHVGEL